MPEGREIKKYLPAKQRLEKKSRMLSMKMANKYIHIALLERGHDVNYAEEKHVDPESLQVKEAFK